MAYIHVLELLLLAAGRSFEIVSVKLLHEFCCDIGSVFRAHRSWFLLFYNLSGFVKKVFLALNEVGCVRRVPQVLFVDVFIKIVQVFLYFQVLFCLDCVLHRLLCVNQLLLLLNVLSYLRFLNVQLIRFNLRTGDLSDSNELLFVVQSGLDH